MGIIFRLKHNSLGLFFWPHKGRLMLESYSEYSLVFIMILLLESATTSRAGNEDGPWKGPGPPLLVAADF